MLIMPPGHARTVAVRRPLRQREKWMVGSVLGLVLAAAIALVISFATPGQTTGNGCVDVTIPGAVGGTELHRCGGAARELCTSARMPGAYSDSAARAIIAECRKIGLAGA